MMNSQQKVAKRRLAKSLLGFAVIAGAVGSAGIASAAPLIDVTITGTTTQGADPSTYTSNVTAAPGQTVYYQVVATLAPAGTGNSNHNYTIGTSQSASDGFGGGAFVFTDSDSNANLSLAGPSLANGFGAGSGAGATVSGETITVSALLGTGAANVSMTGTGAQFLTGSFVAGNVPETLSGVLGSAGFDAKITLAASEGDHQFTASAQGTSPYVGFTSLSLTPSVAPEPASLGLLAMGSLALLARRRKLV